MKDVILFASVFVVVSGLVSFGFSLANRASADKICYPHQGVGYIQHGDQIGAVCAGDGALYYKKRP